MDGGFGELLLAAFGLYLVIEGGLLALFPHIVPRIAAMAQRLPPSTLRAGGVVAVAVGVAIIWLVRG